MERGLVFLFLVILGSAHGEFPSIPNPDITKFQQTRAAESYRLPGDTIPLLYEVELEPNFDDFSFSGGVVINIRVVEETDTITLHAAELADFSDIQIDIDGNVIVVEADDLELDTTDYEFLKIPIGETLSVDTQLKLSMRFTGTLNENNRGFYRAAYLVNGEPRWFATTQFEATSARRAFPCYDEPGIKTPFKISLIRSDSYHSISNMDLDETIILEADDKFMDVYVQSDDMPTYLVAFVVSDLGATEYRERQAVYADESKIDRAEYGLQSGIDILEAMEEFTDYPYVLPKMFQVAIPNSYFSAGAMENWGLVTYREQYLLYKEGISTASEQQTIASIIAHEYGHQWFGNLVSPAWWQYIWLNEGFATYFEYQACHDVYPEMRMMEQIVTSTVQFAMESDATDTTRIMSQDAQTPSEISSLFDRIAYDKSGAVIRMIEHILTTDVYKRALNIYLNEMKFKAAVASDLWTAIQEAVDESGTDPFNGRSVQDVMETWELQAGFPVITATRGEGKITLKQERYFTNLPTTTYSSVWSVAINYATASSPVFTDTRPQYWLTEASEDFEIAVADDDWFILNKQETGYYRVNYDKDNWNLLIDYLNTTNYNRVHLLNRAQLVDDSLNLARSGRLDYNTTMNLLLYLKRETDYIPLYSFFRGLPYLYKFIVHTEQHMIFKKYLKEVLQGAYTALGTDASRDTHTDKLNRINVLTWLCRVEHEACVELMHTKLYDLSQGGTAISPDLQTLVYCSGQRYTDHAEHKLEYLVDRYLGDEAEELEKRRILSAIGCSNSEIVLKRVLDIAIGKDGTYQLPLTSQTVTAFSSVYTQSDVGLHVALDYITDNFDDLDTLLTTNQVSSILTGIADRLNSEELIVKFNTFANNLPTELEARHYQAINNANIIMLTNVVWSYERLGEITDFLIVYGNGYVVAISIPLLILTLLSHIFV